MKFRKGNLVQMKLSSNSRYFITTKNNCFIGKVVDCNPDNTYNLECISCTEKQRIGKVYTIEEEYMEFCNNDI